MPKDRPDPERQATLAELERRIAELEATLDALGAGPGGLASRQAEGLRGEILDLERRRMDIRRRGE